MQTVCWQKRIGRTIFMLWALVMCFNVTSLAQDKKNVLQTLKKEHPRLILTAQDVPRIKKQIEEDSIMREMYNDLKRQAGRIMRQSTVEYKIVGPRLLSQSRNCLSRVYTLSLLYLLDGEQEYLDRVKQEVFAAAEFPDWNPSHFLDTAEMSHAFAIAYDWLYPYLNDAEKEKIRTALIDKGLMAYKRGYETNAWWVTCTHNWNQVCHGGIGIGALAIADEQPDLCSQILNEAIEKMPLALKSYAPDGGWNEGPGYWHYATRYTVYFLAALDTTLGTDFGLSEFEGFDNAGQFRIDFQSPTGLSFNYADAGQSVRGTHEMYWLAKRFDRPVYAWFQRQDQSADALDLIWYSSQGSDPAQSGLSLDAFYKGIDVTFFRSAWNDPNAIFCGFKGGDNKANHSHLDLGSFVLDALGQRWAVDLGGDNYNLPGYFGSQRWTYYRLNTESHNTLYLNKQNQNPSAPAPITRFVSRQDYAFAITDLSTAYKESADKVQRGFALVDRKHVLIQDEIESNKKVDIEWGFITSAAIDIDGDTATLQLEGKHLQVRILEPENATFQTLSANPPEPQHQQPEMKKLAIHLIQESPTSRITVVMTPYEGEKPPAYNQPVKALKDWN